MTKACPDAYAIAAKMEDVGMVMVAIRLLVPAEDPWSERRKHVVEEVLAESSRGRDIEVTYAGKKLSELSSFALHFVFFFVEPDAKFSERMGYESPEYSTPPAPSQLGDATLDRKHL